MPLPLSKLCYVRFALQHIHLPQIPWDKWIHAMDAALSLARAESSSSETRSLDLAITSIFETVERCCLRPRHRHCYGLYQLNLFIHDDSICCSFLLVLSFAPSSATSLSLHAAHVHYYATILTLHYSHSSVVQACTHLTACSSIRSLSVELDTQRT